ncbi:MAG: phospho-N-acetylmuramoyl-pentapeptide-transferase [Dehalococcoidia bacterium]|nr:phospho-N-acetylmuramoyl-pentapeptide-transferase [Dehalococcoidia bacterium]
MIFPDLVYVLALGVIAFVVAMLWARPLVALLRKKKVGKQIRDEGPASHTAKAGTPTMGGILILMTSIAVTVVLNLVGQPLILIPLGVATGAGLLGAVDDSLNLVGGKRRGIQGRVKIAVLSAISIVAALVMIQQGMDRVIVPAVGTFSLGWWFAPVAVVLIVGFANAVNLTDGLDSLAGGTAAFAFLAYGVIAYLGGQAYLAAFCFTIIGSTMAFLWYNAHPAQVFMGDTGSLALGAALATIALMTGQWLLLAIVGIVFVAEALSVILQVAYFKATKGRRIFRMSPLHHHFELGGLAETQVTARFWLVGAVAAIVGIALALV